MSLPTPAGLAWWHPAALVATGFGIGHLPWVPGSWGSLAALLCGWEITEAGGRVALATAAIIAFALGVWASARVAAASGAEDPRFVVIDEIAAQWLVLLAAAARSTRLCGKRFCCSGVFDILKPWPIRWIERRVRGGLGIMVDDIGAAIYAVVLLLIGEGIFGVRP